MDKITGIALIVAMIIFALIPQEETKKEWNLTWDGHYSGGIENYCETWFGGTNVSIKGSNVNNTVPEGWNGIVEVICNLPDKSILIGKEEEFMKIEETKPNITIIHVFEFIEFSNNFEVIE